jgi:hypothetical protein
MMEVVIAKDGSLTYRVYGEGALPTPTSAETRVSQKCQGEIDELKKPKSSAT